VEALVKSLPLPDPTIIAGRRYWTRGEIRRWIAAIADKPEPDPQPDDEQLVNARQLRDWLGGVSDMFLHRRQHPGLERFLQELHAAPDRAAAEQIVHEKLSELTATDQEAVAPRIRDILAELPSNV
jgi:hypothetical protein